MMATDQSKKDGNHGNPLSDWMNAAEGFWQQMWHTWSKTMGNMASITPSKKDSTSKTQTSMDKTVHILRNLSGMATEPDVLESFFQGAGAMPKILAKATQSGLNSLLKYQQKWFEQVGKLGQTTEAYQFENLDENVFRAWSDIYEQEFRQYFNIPQLGLVRFYQEKMNQAMDKYNIFQTAMAEFQRLLTLPINRSLTVMQEKLEEMAQKEPLPEDPKTYYRMWVKILEGHYMTLFQSPEYIQTLGNTLNAMSDFSDAKNDCIQDMLSMLPIPKQREIDELYREIYLLKKRIRALEK